MAASFSSSHRDAGGTLHLPSPSASIHHVHSASAINQLRRSLSKSPSKSSDFRFFSAANPSGRHHNALNGPNGSGDRSAAASASPSRHPHPHPHSLRPLHHNNNNINNNSKNSHNNTRHRASSFHHTLNHNYNHNYTHTHGNDFHNDTTGAVSDKDNTTTTSAATPSTNPFVPISVPRPVSSSSVSPSFPPPRRAHPQGRLFLVQSANIPAASTSSPLSVHRPSSAKHPRYPQSSSISAAGAGAGASHFPVAKNTTSNTSATTTSASAPAPATTATSNSNSNSQSQSQSTPLFTPTISTRFSHPHPRHALRRTASLQLCKVRNALNTNGRGSTSPSRRPRQQQPQPQQQQQRPVLNESKNQGNALPRPDTTTKPCATKDMAPLFRTTGNVNTPSAGKADAPLPPLFSSSSSFAVPSPSPLPSKNTSLQFDKRRRDPLASAASRSASNPFALRSSPLKRNDDVMNLDEDNVMDSPSPKRRSVEGPISSQSSATSSKENLDFTVFDTENRDPKFDPSASAGLLSTSLPTTRTPFRDIDPPFKFAVPQSPASSSIPKRSSSLRRSTLQQRQSDKPLSLFASKLDASTEDDDKAAADDQFSSSPAIDSTAMASPSAHHLQHQRLQHLQNTSSHPLSRTVTQSSSEESLPDDSPSHEPVRNSLEKPRPILNFSKSLPAGSVRPTLDQSQLQSIDSLQPPTAAATVAAADAPFATPINYRLVKPLPAAFMSTGLISKRNKNAEDVALAGTKNMPDTPCKRPIFPLLGASTGGPGSASGNLSVGGNGNNATGGASNGFVPGSATVAGGKHKTMNRSALGTNVLCASQSGTSESAGDDLDNDEMNGTTTNMNTREETNGQSNNFNDDYDNEDTTANYPMTAGKTSKTTPHPGPFSKGMGIFGSSFVKSRMMRRSSSSGSIDCDPSQASPSARYGFKHDNHRSLDAEFPPTPTKTFTPATGANNAAGTTGGNSSIFYTARTHQFTKSSSSRRLLLQDGSARSPQGKSSPFGTAGGVGVTTPSGLTCKFSSCSSPSSPTSGDTLSDSAYESDDGLNIELDFDDDDEDGDTAMDGSPSFLGNHRRGGSYNSRCSTGQNHGLPPSFSSSNRVAKPRFVHESTQSPSLQDRLAIQLHKSISQTSPSHPSSLFRVIAVEQNAKQALQSTASPLYGKTSLFMQSAAANQSAAPELPSSTPHTPFESYFPLNSNQRSIFAQNATPTNVATPVATNNGGLGGNVASAGSTRSYFGDNFAAQTATGFPATPTGPRDSIGSLNNDGAPGTVDINALKKASLRGNSHEKVDIDICLTNRFKKVEIIGIGEFSQVFMVANDEDGDDQEDRNPSAMNGVTMTPNANAITPFQSPSMPVTRNMLSTIGHHEKVWAVKKSKQPFSGARDRERRAKEVEALKALKGSMHLISYEDSWEDNGYLYIQTEYCEEGSLKDFLDITGWKGRADDFRIWKIMLELADGLKHIHNSGYIHLDLKPANVLVAADGVLKIADFGLATPWPAEHGIDGEGDREYIGPEILMGRYDKPADIFALGLIIFEAASNVELPDNGLAWQKLRNGDMSDAPTLSWRDDADCPTVRDTKGMPVAEVFSFSPGAATSIRSGELEQPPEFMVNPAHESSLDSVVRWMISPDPADRPTAQQVLDTSGIRWVAGRRRAGATIYEGNWGPADAQDDEEHHSGEDEEMIDV